MSTVEIFHWMLSRCTLSVLALLACNSTSAFANPEPAKERKDGPAVPASQPDSPPDSRIVVQAYATVRSSVDRTTYIIRETLDASVTDGLGILQRIPQISVTPNGEIRVLGRSDVQILVDGKIVSNPQAFLRTLRGSDIQSVEVSSNPSAQYSASGSGGAINIISRRVNTKGRSGSASTKIGSVGLTEMAINPRWSDGSQSLSGNLAISRTDSESRLTEERLVADEAVEGSDVSEERRLTATTAHAANGSIRFARNLGAMNAITLTGLLGANRTAGRVVGAISGSTVPELDWQAYNTGAYARIANITADILHYGVKRENNVTASMSQSSSMLKAEKQTIKSGFGSGRASSISTAVRGSDTQFKVDVVRLLGSHNKLSLGVGARESYEKTNFHDRRFSDADLGGAWVGGTWLELSSYATVDLKLFSGDLRIGVRGEGRNYHVGIKQSTPEGYSYHIFPSVHFKGSVLGLAEMGLSFSSRIRWPTISELSPELRLVDFRNATRGTAGLRSERSNVYELSLGGRIKDHRIVATVNFQDFHRSIVRIPADVDDLIISSPINGGSRTDLALGLALSGSIRRGLSYSASVTSNFASLTAGYQGLNRSRRNARLGGEITLEYRRGIEGHRGADHIRLSLNRRSGVDYGYARAGPYLSSSLTWTHNITNRFSFYVSVSDLLASETSRSASFSPGLIIRQQERSERPRIQFSLIRSLGR